MNNINLKNLNRNSMDIKINMIESINKKSIIKDPNKKTTKLLKRIMNKKSINRKISIKDINKISHNRIINSKIILKKTINKKITSHLWITSNLISRKISKIMNNMINKNLIKEFNNKLIMIQDTIKETMNNSLIQNKKNSDKEN